ncbi:MAG TPA: hypothetical protein VIL44_11505 [Micromonospora sp.]
MDHPLATDAVDWHDIPGVQLVGAIIGIMLIIAAIQKMIGKD